MISNTKGYLVLTFNGCNFLLVCRSYEEVGWDTKLPQRWRAAEASLEKMADSVSERPSSRRYHSRPQLWQVSCGAHTVTNDVEAGAQLRALCLGVICNRWKSINRPCFIKWKPELLIVAGSVADVNKTSLPQIKARGKFSFWVISWSCNEPVRQHVII